jgi:hypothetical protein
VTAAVARRGVFVQGRPHSFGWLRNSTGDEIHSHSGEYWEAWETPRGRAVLLPRLKPDEPVTVVTAIRRENDLDWVVVAPPYARQL